MKNEVCQWLCDRSVDFSGSYGSSINKTDCHDITEILLKVSLNTINQTYEWRTSVLLWKKIFIGDYFMNRFVVILPIFILMEILLTVFQMQLRSILPYYAIHLYYSYSCLFNMMMTKKNCIQSASDNISDLLLIMPVLSCIH